MIRFSASSVVWLLLAASSVPMVKAAPTPAPTPYEFQISDLTDIFNELTAITGPLSAQDVLNTEIPLVGSSINEMIGGDAAKSIATLLDFSRFVTFVEDGNPNLKLNRAEIAAELTDYLQSLDTDADLSTGAGCTDNVAVTYTKGSTSMQIDFCVVFTLERSSTVSGEGLFDNIPDIFAIDMNVALDFEATLLFKAQLAIELEPTPTAVITVDPVIATLSAEGDVDITVGVGVLELFSTATATVDASFELALCDDTTDTCDEDILGLRLGTSDFYLQRSASYLIGGNMTLGTTFPGLTLGGDAYFAVEEADIFEPAPIVTFENFNAEDFINFSPENSVAMLRLIDSAIVRAQENEAFNTNIPLTNTSMAQMLSTGSVVTSSLLRLFQKVEAYEDRPTKSLFLKQSATIAPTTADKTDGTTYEIYLLIGNNDVELNVNPDNQPALYDLVSTEGVVCSITFEDDFVSSETFSSGLLTLLQGANCPGLTVCDAEQCVQDEVTGDFSECNNGGTTCELAVGFDDVDNLAFIVSNADFDVQLIGFMEPLETTKGEGSIYNFPVNTPAFPALIPRFRSWQNFTDFIADAISSSIDIVDASVEFSYSEATVTDPAQYELVIGFSKSATFSVALNASEGIGDLIDITVSEGSSLDLTVSAAFETTFGVIMEADDEESLIVLAEPCGGEGFTCVADSLDIVLFYVEDVGATSEEFWLNTTVASSGSKSVTQELEDAIGSVATVTEQGTSLLVIRFIPTISEVKLLLLKNCLNVEDTTIVEQTDVLECAEDERSDPIANDYGLEDFSLSKRKWQIAIGDSSITANITVSLDVTLSTNVGGVIEVTAELDGTISGYLELSIGTGELLPFSDWLVGLINIFGNSTTEGYIEDFFEASATFEASFDASVEPSSPFNLLATASATGNFAEPFVIDFLSKDFAYPEIDFEVDIEGIGDVRKLTFKQVVAILADVLEFLVGSNEDDGVDSCSGGLLGQDAFTYQLPVLGISVCSTAAFLQVLVEAVQELVDETSTSGNKTTTTFSSLEAKLETLLQDGVGGTPTVNITTTSDDIRSELSVELTLEWAFSQTETFVLDMSEYFTEEEIASNAGLEFFANALLPGSGEGQFGIEGSLSFTMGVGLEYVSATKEINPFVKGTTGFKLQLGAGGVLDYDCSVGAFQGSVDAEFNFGDGSGGPMELSVGLDEELNYYLSNPGTISASRPGFITVAGISGLVSEVEALFSGKATANVTAGLSLLGLSIDVDAEISDLQAFFLGNTSVLVVDFTPTLPEFKVPTLLDILLAEPQGIIDALDDVFETAEEASVGENGIITQFPVPFIRNGLGDALGAGTSNNILAKGRNKVIPFLQTGLNSFEGKTDTVGDVLARLMDKAMDAVEPSLRREDESTDFICYIYNNDTDVLTQEIVNCTDDDTDPTSVMWSLPFGQTFTIDLPLDFDLDAGSFPLEITFDGGDSSLSIGWGFDLAFGYMEGPGFFLYTFPDDGPEITIEAGLSILGFTLDATLLFLRGTLSNGNLQVAVGLSVDMDKGNALRLKVGENATDPQYGRLTRDSFRKITKISDLFVPGATAGATVEIPEVRFQVSASLLGGGSFAEDVVAYIPQLTAEIYAQSRKVVSTDDSPARRLKFDTTRRNLRVHPALAEHEAAPLLRSLSFSDEFPLLADDFEFDECPVEENATFCARVSQLTLDMEKINDLIGPTLSDLTNGDETGFLDKMVRPLIFLDERLPGISDILNKKITVLDIAEAMIGPKSGAPTVRRIIQTYYQINDLITSFVEEGGLLLAEDCDVLDSFSCTGGVFSSRRLKARVSDQMNQVFDFEDASLLPTTPSHLIEQDRDLQATIPTFVAPDCVGTCPSTLSITNKVICQKRKLVCKGNSVNGLSFPFMNDLTSVVGLLSGGDIQIIDFSPDPVTFAFTFELFFVLYTPPTVELTITFEFTAVLRVGFVLDSKGIREAVEQEAPEKALNSFALKDTFDGVDEAMITLTASVTIAVDVSAVIVKVGVSGKITFLVTVDLYDPYPEKSGGLVRPFELLTSGSSPLEWFEFGIQIFITISLYIKIGLFLGFVEITLYKYEVEYKFDLIPPLIFTPAIDGMSVEATANGSLQLAGSGSYDLECTSLEGETGNERIECIEGLAVQDFAGIKRMTDSSSIAGLASSAKLLVRNIASQVSMPNTQFGAVTFDYETGTEILSNDEIIIFEKEAVIGKFQMTFGSIGTATLKLPTPEQAFLTTTINDCDTTWEFMGHTNMFVNASALQEGCNVVADGGESTDAKLTIDFGFEDDMPCVDGNIVKLSMASDKLVADITRKTSSGSVINQFTFGSPFIYIEIKMSNCEDKVFIESTTTNKKGYISVQTGDDDDEVIIGTDDDGLANVFVSIQVDGDDGDDTLTVIDTGETAGRSSGQLSSASVLGLLFGSDASKTDLDFTSIEILKVYLSQGPNEFFVDSTPPYSESFIYFQNSNDVLTVNDTQGDLLVMGAGGNDKFYVYGAGDNSTITIYGEDDDDYLLVDGTNGNKDISVNTLDTSSVRWSGGLNDDEITVMLTSTGTSDIDLFDDIGEGINKLTIECSNLACYLLSRQNFIANIHNGSDVNSDVERVSVDIDSVSINTIQVNLNNGENEMYFDDTMGPMNVFGGNDADSFYIGQLYNSERDEVANVNINDPVTTTLTTMGYLSDGNSFSLTVNGGFGNDYFDVLRNRFLLDLNGDSDDDLFVVRSFLALDLDIAGNPDTNTSLGNVTLAGADGSDTFDLSGSSNNPTESSELPNYVVNSLVDVDGGTGNDKLIVVGTEADDRYVVTAGSVFGGGLTISFTNIEALVLTGGAGDDTLTVLSTSPNLALYLYGGEGSDTFVITPRNVDPVVSKNLRGHRGILEHTVSSVDPSYNGLRVEGIAVDVLDNDGDSAYFNVIEAEAVHVMDEDGLGSFDFWVYPTVVPSPSVTVQVAAQTDENGNPWLLLNGDTLTAIELVFETAEPQKITATFNPVAVRLEITDYNLLIKLDLVPLESPDPRFETTAQTIRPVSVKLLPSQDSVLAKSVTVVEPNGYTYVGEGEKGWSSTYDVYLRPCTDAMIQDTVVEIVPTEVGKVRVTPEVIEASSWGTEGEGCKVTVEVTPVENSDEEGIHFVTLVHNVADSNANDILLSDNSTLYAESVLVRIYDDLVPNVIIKESLGVTSTAEVDQAVIDSIAILNDESFYVDSYTIRLASEPSEDVIITIESIAKASDYDPSKNTDERVQVLIGDIGSEAETLQLTFTKLTWFVEQTVRVIAKNDNIEEGVDLLHFPDQPSFLAYIQGPIFIEGDTSADVPSILEAVLFPGENDTDLFALFETAPSELVYSELQVDTLKIFNIDVQGSTPSLGTLSSSQFVGYNMAKELVIAGEKQNDGITYNGMEVIEFYLGTGVDRLTVESSSVAVHYVDLSDGDDSVDMKNISGHFIIHGGDGSDTVTVTSDKSTVGEIQGLLAFDGGSGESIDHLIVDNSGDTISDDVLNVTRNTVEIESMANTDDAESRVPRDVFIVNLRGATGGTFNLAVYDPIKEVTVDSDIPYPTSSEIIEEVLQDLIFPAVEGDTCGKNETSRCAETVKVYSVGDDAFAVFFLGERLNEGVNLTLTTTDLDDFTPEMFLNETNDILLRSSDVAYADIELLDVTMGNPTSSNSKVVVNVRGTTATTTITTQDGDDDVFISSDANEDVSTSSTVDFLHGWLDYIERDLTVNAAKGRHRLLISDESSSVGKGPAVFSSTSFTAIHEDVGDIFFTANGGNWISGVNLWLSPENDEVHVESIPSDPTSPTLQTTTSVHCGDGNDILVVSIDESNAVFVANGQGGNDVLDASASSIPVILFGDAGSDTLTGGTSNDIIFGDFGRVQWRSLSSNIFGAIANANGAIVAQAGGGGYGDFTDGVLRFVTDAFSLSFDEGGSDTIVLGQGDDCAIGGYLDDSIFGNLGNDIIFGDSAKLLFDIDSGYPTSLSTLGCDQGGNDILSSGEGVVNYIVGGSFDDTIQCSGAMDLAFGDHASISLYGDTSHKLKIAITVNASCSGGSDDIRLGDGDDIAFGGALGDYIEGNGGQDVIFGDFGQFDTETEFLDHQNYQSFIEFSEFAGDDEIFGGDGDDFLFGQEGSDKVYGESGNDDIYGGHNLDFGQDSGDELLSGGADEDSILGDNGQIVRQLLNDPAPDFPWVNGMVWRTYTEPFDTEVIRDIRRYDDVDEIGGDDNIEGGDGNDVLHGQRGDDVIDGGNGQDEIYGELGSDTLSGGPGSDIVIGDVGYIVRRYKKDGSARLNTDGTWHKDIVLEELGYITGVDRISQKVDVKTSSLTIESVMSSSLLFVAPAYTSSGAKYSSGSDTWLTDLIQFELLESFDDVMDGGDGDDIVIGQRGDDTINGGAGNDVLIGDAGWNVVPVHMDLPQIHQVYRALRDNSNSNYVVEGVSDKEYGILFAAEYELYPDQYGQIDFLGSIVDMVLNADHVLSGHNLLRDVLGVAGISTVNGNYCVHPMFRITPGFLRDKQKMHGNDIIVTGLGDNLVIGDDIRAYSGVDVADVPEIVTIRRRIDNLVHALGIRLSTMEVDQESFSGGIIGPYNISVGDDEIVTTSGGFSLVTGDTMTLVARTVGSGSFVSGQRIRLNADKLKSMMQRLADVERILWDVNIGLYELHTDLLIQMTAKYSKQIGQKSSHALSLANDIITSNGNGDILIGDSSLLYFHVEKSPSAYSLRYLNRSQKRYTSRKLRDLPDKLKSSLLSHVGRLSRSASFSGQAPFDDIPFALTVGSDTLQQNFAVNLAAGDFAFFGSVVTFQSPESGSLAKYTQSIKNVRSKLASDDPVASLQFGIKFYAERYSQLSDASKSKLHGDTFIGLDNSNIMLGEFLTGEMYNAIDSAETTRVAVNANAFSSSAAQDFAGDYFNIQPGTAANGQFGPDFSVSGIAINAEITSSLETSMEGLFLQHRLIQDIQEILYIESGQLRADRVGAVSTGPHCFDAETSSTIAPAA